VYKVEADSKGGAYFPGGGFSVLDQKRGPAADSGEEGGGKKRTLNARGGKPPSSLEAFFFSGARKKDGRGKKGNAAPSRENRSSTRAVGEKGVMTR